MICSSGVIPSTPADAKGLIKTAIFIFNRGRDLSKVLAQISPTVAAHPAYVKGFRQIVGLSLGSRLTHVWLER